MRLFFEIFLAAALVVLAWNKPYSEWFGTDLQVDQLTARATGRQPVGGPSPTKGEWMWDPNRKSALDRPAYNQSRSSTSQIRYVDAEGKEYWIDSKGRRHYDR